MEFSLRTAKVSEKNIIYQLFQQAASRPALRAQNHWQYWHNPPKSKTDWVEEGLMAREFSFIINAQQQVIGMFRLMRQDKLYWGEQTDSANYIHSLCLADGYEGKGIGRQVIAYIENESRKQGLRYLRLDCDANNPHLVKFYSSLGFEKQRQVKLPLSTYQLFQKELS